jgi:pantothenate kinase
MRASELRCRLAEDYSSCAQAHEEDWPTGFCVMTIPGPLMIALHKLLETGGRHIVGIVGPPGSGKSTFASAVAAAFAPDAVVLPMDGFHLAQRQLVRLGRANRKGAPDTFDVRGLIALLRRVRDDTGSNTVFAPDFDRSIEEPIAGAVAIEPGTGLILVEGNYLLHDDEWIEIAPLLDESWYLDTPYETRTAWLLERHVRYGRDREAAMSWIAETDAPNALIVQQTQRRATRVINWPPVEDVSQ